MTVYKETCLCGASIEVEGQPQTALDSLLENWRNGHKHSETPFIGVDPYVPDTSGPSNDWWKYATPRWDYPFQPYWYGKIYC